MYVKNGGDTVVWS